MPTVKEVILQEAQSLSDDVTMNDALIAIYRRCLLEERTSPDRDGLKRHTMDEAREKFLKCIEE